MQTGLYLVGEYKFTKEFRNKETQEVSKSYVLHVGYANGLKLEKTIYFPRNEPGLPPYSEPNLIKDKVYAFAITDRGARDGKGNVTYTAVREQPPMPAGN